MGRDQFWKDLMLKLTILHGFQVTENFVLDPMHTLLEGVVPFELHCILTQLVNVKGHFSMADLNSRLHSFFEKNSVDKGNKPPTINPLQTSQTVLSPSMKAVQMWSLLKYLPLFTGNLVPADDLHWLFLLQLCELVDFVFAPKFTKGMVAYLREIISDHLRAFQSLCGHICKLKPKRHFFAAHADNHIKEWAIGYNEVFVL